MPRFGLLPTLRCSGKVKCYEPMPGKKKGGTRSCQTPSAWLIFLRINKHRHMSIKELAEEYKNHWKPAIVNRVKSKNLSAKEDKAEYRRVLCRVFDAHVKSTRGAALKKMLAKDTSNEKARIEAAAVVARKEKVREDTRRKMAAAVKKHVAADVLAFERDKEAAAAKDKAARAKSAAASKSRAASAAKRSAASASASPATRSKARKLAISAKAAVSSEKKAVSAARSKETAASGAKRKATSLRADVTRAKKKVRVADTAVSAAKKTRASVTKTRAVPRALALLKSDLKSQPVSASARSRKRTRRA